MKKVTSFLLLAALCCPAWQAVASVTDTVFIRETNIPVLIDRQDNELFHLRIDNGEGKKLDRVSLDLGTEVDLAQVEAVKLYYGGTECMERTGKGYYAPVAYVSAYTVGQTRAANPSYSILKSEVRSPGRQVVFDVNQSLYPGINYFWVSLQMKPQASLLAKFLASVSSVEIDGQAAPLKLANGPRVHRMGFGVRQAGDDGVAAYRIPGLVTSNKGTLLAVYDVRHNSSVDLQEYIEIGLSRSIDGGQTWEKMQIPMSFGEYGGLPKAQNGVGDPAILVDKQTGTIWIMAAWTHGMGNARAWNNSGQGMTLEETAQLMLVKSDDDGKTWSEPINITSQVKAPEWYFLLQGPGRGISMVDGTLVFAGQFIGADRIPCACIIYSKDHGKTWHISQPARSNTTESQVAEVEPGVLMLNMRDNRGGSRAVAVTRDFGATWEEHPSSRKALVEPVCMASLLHVAAEDNVTGKPILLFSNPDSPKNRHRMTIKASLDNGLTWLPENRLMLDEGGSWGYSCLTMIDRETVGILYESSTAHILFQAVKLEDILNLNK